jgi:bifunctional non-homologous end joining protein LigD
VPASKLRIEADGHTIECTNTDRVVFPARPSESGALHLGPSVDITKGDVIEYYSDLADIMVPEMSGRPLTLERYTKGLAGGGFFQKHVQKHFPEWIERVTLGAKAIVTYPMANSAAALVYFANQGALAFHVWTSREDTPTQPDLIVFDLDPPEGGFELVRQTALILRDELKKIGLTGFVKTTGSKGLHIVAPLDGEDDFDDVSTLGHELGKYLAAKHPKLVTMEFYKKDRGGRLYFDVGRNVGGATFVAAYSLRGKANAPVSAPLEWEEVEDKKLRSDAHTLQTIRERLAKHGDPWKHLRKKPGSATKALAKLRG